MKFINGCVCTLATDIAELVGGVSWPPIEDLVTNQTS